jgi:hypothetical protein
MAENYLMHVFLLKLLIENIGFPVNIVNKKTNEDVMEGGGTFIKATIADYDVKGKVQKKFKRYSIMFCMKFTH